MSGRPACDDPNASRMRSVGELASVQAIPRVFQSVLSLVDITDLTLSCEASPGNGCLAGDVSMRFSSSLIHRNLGTD